MEMYHPAHPGEVLKEYLDGISVTAAAEKLGVTRVTLSCILNRNQEFPLKWLCDLQRR